MLEAAFEPVRKDLDFSNVTAAQRGPEVAVAQVLDMPTLKGYLSPFPLEFNRSVSQPWP